MTAEPVAIPIPDDHVILLFGATGDLAKRKLLPGLYHLFEAGLLPRRWRLIGNSRGELSDAEFQATARAAVERFGRMRPTGETWEAFRRSLSYVPSTRDDALPAAVEQARRGIGADARLLHYLAVPPTAFADLVRMIGESRAAERARVVVEKPFGYDLASARELNATLHAVFDESQVFRIDHFLGKEAVLNILAMRFANGMFEPIWNRDHIDHIQIDVPETLTVGTRAGFYDRIGAFRDMVVTHLFQALSFVAMEPPRSFAPEALIAEKTKVFDSMPPLEPEQVVRGQYEGYRSEAGVAPDSDTETLVALRVFVQNERWAGVPIYLRTGKYMAESRQLLTIAFRQPPRHMFPIDSHYAAETLDSDHLTFELGDPGTISASFLAKVPGATMQLGEAHMDFSYAHAFGGSTALDSYERLIHDVMIGDRTLFTTSPGIERLWEISAPLLERPPAVERYAAGSWGPVGVQRLIAPARWRLPGTKPG